MCVCGGGGVEGCGGQTQSSGLWRRERELLCVKKSIGSLFAGPGRQLAMRTD